MLRKVLLQFIIFAFTAACSQEGQKKDAFSPVNVSETNVPVKESIENKKPLLNKENVGSIDKIPEISKKQSPPAVLKNDTDETPGPRHYGWWNRRNRIITKKVKDCSEPAILFAGDSITEDWELNGIKATEKYLGHWTIINAGIGGDRTRHLYYRLDSYDFSRCKIKATVLMIGTNDTHDRKAPDQIALGIKNVINLLQKKFPNSPVLLYAIFPRGFSENAYRKNNDKINSIIKKFHDGKNIFFFNINNKFLNSRNQITKKVMHDYLHLTPASYAFWASHISKSLKNILGKKASNYIKITPWSHRFMLLAQPTSASQRIDFISGI